MSATRIFYNGKIYTVNKNQPWAQAIVLDGNKIVYVGDDAGALAMKTDKTQVQDLQGRMMMPGFIDGHIHPLMAAAFASGIQLAECRNEEEVLQTIRDYVAAHPDKETYFGHGFADEMFADHHPTADQLDAICADKPMLLVASSCHGAWCNHKAFEVAGIDKNTPDITPGSNYFVRDAEGNPAGRCIESCYINVAKGANYFPKEVFSECLKGLGRQFAEMGYTTFVDCGVYSFVVDSLNQEFADFLNSDDFTQRIIGGFYLATNIEDVEEAIEGAAAIADNLLNTDRLAFRFFKILGDGVLESKSAAMVRAYDDGTKAVPNFDSEQAKKIGLLVAKSGYDLNMHAIGDATNIVALDMLEAIRDAGYKDTRMVISHSQAWQPGQVERAARLGAFINSTGSWHLTSNESYKENVGIEFYGYQYPIRSLIDLGCKYGQGSDFPVADGKPSPFVSIEVGMTRLPVGSTDPLPDMACESPTLEESIESFTINNAYEARMEDKIGSIEVGKLADLVILDQNLFEIPTNQIHKTQILETIRDGLTTYKA